MAATPAPTFNEVFAAPDDAKLNLDYAYAAADAGNLLAAAAAIERVLLVHPDWHAVRLYYASLLYRLDDLQGSSEQLRQLDKAPLTPLQRKEADKYLRLTATRHRPSAVHGVVALGGSYESDAIGALVTQVDIPGGVVKKPGNAVTAFGQLEGAVELDHNGDISAFGSVMGYDKSHVSGPNADFQLGEVQAGLSGKTLMSTWRVGALVRDTRLFNNPYLVEFGARGQGTARLSSASTLTGSLEATYQNYDDPFLKSLRSLLGGNRNGWRYEATIGITHRFDARSSATLLAAYEHKAAGYRPFAYDAPRIEATYNAVLGRGAYLNARGVVAFVDYKAPDVVFVGGLKRKDTRSYGRLAIGAPLSAFTALGATGDGRENVAVEAAATYAGRNSKQPLADFASFGGEVRVVWRFGDGS